MPIDKSCGFRAAHGGPGVIITTARGRAQVPVRSVSLLRQGPRAVRRPMAGSHWRHVSLGLSDTMSRSNMGSQRRGRLVRTVPLPERATEATLSISPPRPASDRPPILLYPRQGPSSNIKGRVLGARASERAGGSTRHDREAEEATRGRRKYSKSSSRPTRAPSPRGGSAVSRSGPKGWAQRICDAGSDGLWKRRVIKIFPSAGWAKDRGSFSGIGRSTL